MASPFSVIMTTPKTKSSFQRFRLRRQRRRRRRSRKGKVADHRVNSVKGGRERGSYVPPPPPPPPIFKTGSLNRSRESESASQREELQAPREERESAADAAAAATSYAIRPSPPEKQVSLFHFLAAGEPNRTNERTADHTNANGDVAWTRRPPSVRPSVRRSVGPSSSLPLDLLLLPPSLPLHLQVSIRRAHLSRRAVAVGRSDVPTPELFSTFSACADLSAIFMLGFRSTGHAGRNILITLCRVSLISLVVSPLAKISGYRRVYLTTL